MVFKNYPKYLKALDVSENIKSRGAYIKYVGGGARGFYKFFKKKFVAQETIGLNISWPSNFFQKIFHGPSHHF